MHQVGTTEAPFVYGNFVSSLDGRIALMDTAGGESYLPEALTNPNDLRLFFELEAQADCLITHAGYLRFLTRIAISPPRSHRYANPIHSGSALSVAISPSGACGMCSGGCLKRLHQMT